MPGKIKYDIDAYKFLMDLNSLSSPIYDKVVRKIHSIANNPKLKGSVHVNFDLEVKYTKGREIWIFTYCRFIEVLEYTIAYTWTDSIPDTIFITGIYET